MKITICGSMHFAKEMLETHAKITELGHDCILPSYTIESVQDPILKENFDFILKNDCQMGHYKKIAESDAILILNFSKNNIDGYIGGAVLMELAIAKYLGKKIFVLNELPNEDSIRYIFEVKLCQPIILNGDLTKID